MSSRNICEEIKKSGKSIKVTITSHLTNLCSFKASDVFIHLQIAVPEASTFHLFELKRHIRIKIDASNFAICRMLCQFSFSNDYIIHNDNYLYPNLFAENSKWHLIAFFLQKMITTETCYKTTCKEFLAIVKTFKIW